MGESSVLFSYDNVAKKASKNIIYNLRLYKCMFKEGNALKWMQITMTIVLKPKQQEPPVAEPVVEAVTVEEVAHEEPVEDKAVEADNQSSKPLSLADMMENDDFNMFDKSNDETTIYNDFFKNDK